MRARERALEWLEDHTTETRSRHAADIFLRGRPRLRDRVVAAVYFTAAAGRWQRYESVEVHLAPFAAGLERCRPPRQVVDLGTGTGGAAAMVARSHPDARVVGIDTSRAMLSRARRRHAERNLSFQRGSVLRLPFPNRTFDLVTGVNAVPELEELRRVTTPDAQVLVASTTRPVALEDSDWVTRWREAGFARVDTGAVGRGSWELYERSAAAV
jgi:ubiquinone/menaquinone biosynthesis C-methylase UbiE